MNETFSNKCQSPLPAPLLAAVDLSSPSRPTVTAICSGGHRPPLPCLLLQPSHLTACSTEESQSPGGNSWCVSAGWLPCDRRVHAGSVNFHLHHQATARRGAPKGFSFQTPGIMRRLPFNISKTGKRERKAFPTSVRQLHLFQYS